MDKKATRLQNRPNKSMAQFYEFFRTLKRGWRISNILYGGLCIFQGFKCTTRKGYT